MPEVYRITLARHAESALSGEGARRFGGRWNSPGRPAVYAAGSRALAALEILVHARSAALSSEWVLVSVEIPDPLVAEPYQLPPDWRALPSAPTARRMGDAWLRSGDAPVLRLPSAILPAEPVFLLNPLHPKTRQLRRGEPEPFHFDPRLAP